jgi:integrase
MRRDKLPIPHFTSHDLRRSAATHMVKIGLSLDTVAAVIGHEPGGKNVRVLVKHYLHDDFVDRKTQALKAWGEKLRAIVAGEDSTASTVLEMRRQTG